jgi:hypothetical protein
VGQRRMGIELEEKGRRLTGEANPPFVVNLGKPRAISLHFISLLQY